MVHDLAARPGITLGLGRMLGTYSVELRGGLLGMTLQLRRQGLGLDLRRASIVIGGVVIRRFGGSDFFAFAMNLCCAVIGRRSSMLVCVLDRMFGSMFGRLLDRPQTRFIGFAT